MYFSSIIHYLANIIHPFADILHLLINTLLLYSALKTIIRKSENFPKPLVFATVIAFLVSLSSKNSSKHYIQLKPTHSIDFFTSNQNIRPFLYQSILFLVIGAAIFKPNKNAQFLFITVANIFLSILSVCYYSHHLQILEQPYLIFMVVISIAGYACIFLLDAYIQQKIKSLPQSSQSTIIIRRKAFHLAPLLILPLLAYLNIRLLQIMLCGSFYIIFNLELIRYTQQKSTQNQNNSFDFYKITLKKTLQPVFEWMGDFNKSREKGFWFTHLYLYLTLIISYEIYPTDRIKQNIGLVVMMADGIAAAYGLVYGKVRIYKSKTLQGLMGYILTITGCQIILGYIFSKQIKLIAIISCGILTGLCQLFSGDLDNILCIFVYIAVEKLHWLILQGSFS